MNLKPLLVIVDVAAAAVDNVDVVAAVDVVVADVVVGNFAVAADSVESLFNLIQN